MVMITNIISAVGNNSSVYPLLLRDCGIEVPIKILKTYKQNKDDKEIAYLATRERAVDEYATSGAWIGTIPLVDYCANYFIKKRGFNPDVSIKLANEETGVQGLKYNIEKFKNVKGAEKAVKDLEYVLANQNEYKKLQGTKFFAAMVIPIALMGFVIPKLVFAMTAKTRAKKEAIQKATGGDEFKYSDRSVRFSGRTPFDKFSLDKNKGVSFKGGFAAAVCNLSTVNKMAITDGGYAVGRVSTARTKNERYDLAFKMLGMMYLNFVAPKQLEKVLNFVSSKMFKIDANLDPIILADKKFNDAAMKNLLKLPKTNSAKDLLEFVDNTENSKTLFVQYANKLEKIKMLECGIRDPRAYVDIKELGEFRDSMAKYKEGLYNYRETLLKSDAKSMTAEKIAKSVKKYIMKARVAKTFNILANVGISSYLLACMLPNAQFAFREWLTGSKLEPGLVQLQKK